MFAHSTARTHDGKTIGQILLISALPWMWGCARETKFVNPNDELREKNLELVEQVRHLERQIDEHITQIEVLEGKLKGELFEGMEPPKVSQIRFGRYSGRSITRGPSRIRTESSAERRRTSSRASAAASSSPL